MPNYLYPSAGKISAFFGWCDGASVELPPEWLDAPEN